MHKSNDIPKISLLNGDKISLIGLSLTLIISIYNINREDLWFILKVWNGWHNVVLDWFRKSLIYLHADLDLNRLHSPFYNVEATSLFAIPYLNKDIMCNWRPMKYFVNERLARSIMAANSLIY